MAAFTPSLSKDPLASTPFLSYFLGSPKFSFWTQEIRGSLWKQAKVEYNHLRIVGSAGRNPTSRLEASKELLTQELTGNDLENLEKTGSDLFGEMKHGFLRFKRQQFLANLVHFQNLAEAQAPQFLVIACADSRVCPSAILGFQPGEAFIVRNVANLVPPFEHDPSETSAALEFAVNSLEVENILVIGHSRCGGIRALISMEDEVNCNGSFIRKWVSVGKNARSSTKSAAADLSFEQQCTHCEKESVNTSMMNLLTYPWIEQRVSNEILLIHGAYYDFVNCTFEKWTLDYKGSMEDNIRFAVKDRSFWC